MIGAAAVLGGCSIYKPYSRPEINTESSRIRIGSQIGFDIIDQSSAFAKGHIQFTIHSGTSKDIIQQIECSTFVIIRIIATATDHNMRLMCISGHCQMFRHIQRRRCTAILYLHIRNIQQVFFYQTDDSLELVLPLNKKHHISRLVKTAGKR